MINDDNDNGNNDYDTMMIIISHKDNGVGTRRNHLLSVPGNVQWIVLFYGVSSWWSGGLAKKAVTVPKGHSEIWNMIYPDHWSGRSIFQKFHGRHISDSDTSNVSKFGQILQQWQDVDLLCDFLRGIVGFHEFPPVELSPVRITCWAVRNLPETERWNGNPFWWLK